jgi:hypothetical protein
VVSFHQVLLLNNINFDVLSHSARSPFFPRNALYFVMLYHMFHKMFTCYTKCEMKFKRFARRPNMCYLFINLATHYISQNIFKILHFLNRDIYFNSTSRGIVLYLNKNQHDALLYVYCQWARLAR